MALYCQSSRLANDSVVIWNNNSVIGSPLHLPPILNLLWFVTSELNEFMEHCQLVNMWWFTDTYESFLCKVDGQDQSLISKTWENSALHGMCPMQFFKIWSNLLEVETSSVQRQNCEFTLTLDTRHTLDGDRLVYKSIHLSTCSRRSQLK